MLIDNLILRYWDIEILRKNTASQQSLISKNKAVRIDVSANLHGAPQLGNNQSRPGKMEGFGRHFEKPSPRCVCVCVSRCFMRMRKREMRRQYKIRIDGALDGDKTLDYLSQLTRSFLLFFMSMPLWIFQRCFWEPRACSLDPYPTRCLLQKETDVFNHKKLRAMLHFFLWLAVKKMIKWKIY